MFIYLKIYINPSTFFVICRAQQARVCNFAHLWLGNPPCLESVVDGRGRGRMTGGRRPVEEVQTSMQKGREEPKSANRSTPPHRQLRVPEVGEGRQDPIRAWTGRRSPVTMRTEKVYLPPHTHTQRFGTLVDPPPHL